MSTMLWNEETRRHRDALYQQGLTHVQHGEWEAALEVFSRLASQYPDSQEIQDLLRQVRLKASLPKTPQRKRRQRGLLSNRLIRALAVINLVMYLSWGGWLLYQRQIVPALAYRQAIAVQSQLIEKGAQLLAAGDLDQAEAYFRRLLRQDPDNTTAQQALNQIDTKRRVSVEYAEALTLLEAEKWSDALAKLRAIQAIAPGYQDVQQLIARAERQEKAVVAFTNAEASFQAGQWSAAIDAFDTVRREAPNYRPDIVGNRIFQSYMHQAQEMLAALLSDPETEREQLQTVIHLIQQALTVRPSDPEATVQYALVRKYLTGLVAYQRGDWEEAATYFYDIYTTTPDFAGRRVAQRLRQAYFQSGLAYRAAGDQQRAAERFWQALNVKVPVLSPVEGPDQSQPPGRSGQPNSRWMHEPPAGRPIDIEAAQSEEVQPSSGVGGRTRKNPVR